MKKLLKLLAFFLMAGVVLTACSDDDDNIEPQVSQVFVLNEGSDNGSVSSIAEDGTVTNNYYEAMNSIPLGKFPQSMAADDSHVYIVVTTTSGAGYVEQIDKTTFKHTASITGLSYPREIVLLDGKAYVANGNGASGQYPNYIKENNELLVVDLKTFKQTGAVDVGAGPEKMVVSKGKLYVTNSGGFSNDDNTVTIVDTSNDKVVETITVKSCPKDLAVDANGDVWVYCAGVPSYSSVVGSGPAICKISEATGEVTSWDIPSVTAGGIKNIAISKDKKTVYFIADGVYAMSINATELPTTKLIDELFYGIDVHPNTGNLWLCENTVWGNAGDAVFVFGTDGSKIEEYKVGTTPNSTVFAN